MATPILFLTVGLPGVGKTTAAKHIAEERRILRLTPDEWMAPLFGESDADGRRDILEGRMIWTALQVLASGSSVVLDFGCWSAEERYAIRHLTEAAGGPIPSPPDGSDDWPQWASGRWPTLPLTRSW